MFDPTTIALIKKLGGNTEELKVNGQIGYVGQGYILPGTTVELDPNGGTGALVDIINVSEGSTYTVKWNGTDYSCIAQAFDMDGAPVVGLGNVGALSGGESTGEPFVLVFLTDLQAAELGAGVFVVSLDGSTSVTLSIMGETVIPIDTKWLPKPVVLHVDDDNYLYIRPFDGDTSKRMTANELRTIWFSASKVLIYGEPYDNQSGLTTKVWSLAFGYGEVSDNSNKAGWLANAYGTPVYYTAEYPST